jgi:RNA polymerase sigma-70 factor, ECF subfamily
MNADSPLTERPDDARSNVTSTSLLERLKVNDQDAWRTLVDVYGPLVYQWCRRWGIPSTDSQDVVQEVFRAVASAIERFQRDRTRGTFHGWLWTIARNEARDFFADRGRRPQVIGGTGLKATLLHIPEQYPEDAADGETANELANLVRRALAAIRVDFHQPTWQAFWHTTIEGKAAADVARELGSTTRAVRQAKHRVLQRLREEYHDLIEGAGL